ncbi:alanine racemase [Tessaracoccus sp. OH4464_COT-324]|uniref:alanine racemase n=1 Tax=Tessaracoccus sp. OH4464_COT-324 TaxID=2491059 RepID=UPI000F644531|nr:alanine racemase [Tessaracoccus sp. OH4464_COT-324]RRD45590.1 alanine racemase [Tessaracoccus sp. OH4464_COT-324]
MLKLTVEATRWHAHLRRVVDECPGIVPVAKGNGYGFGNALLAREALRLGADTLAVGTAHEVAPVKASGWERDIVVLNPWRPHDALATRLLADPQVITTVSRVPDVARVAELQPGARVVVELETSMHRHGIAADELPGLSLEGVDVVGWAVHLPAEGSLAEARHLAAAVTVSAAPGKPVWFSHLGFDDYRTLAAELPAPPRMRVGTRLWLGDKGAYRATGTVLDVRRLPKGTAVGYHGTRTPKDGCVVVISGGTAHGVALAAPATAHSVRQRLIPLAEGLAEARGQVLSPFTVAGAKRVFAEPPHMHASLVFVDGPGFPAQVGDEVPVNVRMTTTTFDEVVLS